MATAKDIYNLVERPYDKNLQRNSAISPPLTSSDQVILQSPTQLSPGIIDGSTVNNLWISSWIKSKNYKPYTGFFLDSSSGNIYGNFFTNKNGRRIEISSKNGNEISFYKSSGALEMILSPGRENAFELYDYDGNRVIYMTDGTEVYLDIRCYGEGVEGMRIFNPVGGIDTQVPLLELSTHGTLQTGGIIYMTNSGTGKAVEINQTGNATCIDINKSGSGAGRGLDIKNDGTDESLYVWQTNVANADPCVSLYNYGVGRTLNIVQSEVNNAGTCIFAQNEGIGRSLSIQQMNVSSAAITFYLQNAGTGNTFYLDQPLVTNTVSAFYLRNMGTGKFINTSVGANCDNAGVWNNASSREYKEDFKKEDPEKIIENIKELDISNYRYKREKEKNTRHLTPVAEDFNSLFGLGNDKTISPADLAGVSLTAIKFLIGKIETLTNEINILKQQKYG